MRNPSTAAILSFILPGAGQVYNGTFIRALFWLIITPGMWITTGGFLGWVAHILSAWAAYSYAENHLTYE